MVNIAICFEKQEELKEKFADLDIRPLQKLEKVNVYVVIKNQSLMNKAILKKASLNDALYSVHRKTKNMDKYEEKAQTAAQGHDGVDAFVQTCRDQRSV